MQSQFRSLVGFVGALCAVLLSPSPVLAQAFPQRDITFIVPWNAGGANDVMMRALQPILKEDGISIVIENVAGATGSVGLRRVTQAPADGYMLGMGTSSTLALIAQAKTPLKNENFTHLVRVSTDPLLLLVPGKTGPATLEAFIEEMKKNPGNVSIGTPGTYNINHIFASMTARAAGVGFAQVAYTGGAKVVQDLSGGHVQAGILKPSESIGQIQEGLVRPLGVYADARLAALPNVPTFKEKGYDVFPYGPVLQMAYIVAPTGLPKDVETRLTAAFRKALADPRFKTFAEQNSFLTDDLTGDALTAEVNRVADALGTVADKVFPKSQ